MARPRAFDEAAVLDRAVDLFWRQGYQATSLSDLEAATELNRGSIYAAFGDKQGLFLRVLDRYYERFGDPSFGGLADAASPRAAVIALFEQMPGSMTASGNPRGCLVASTCAESHEGEIGRKASACLARMETGFYAALRRMQTLGELSPQSDARQLARFLTGVAQGMAIISRVTDDTDFLRDIATTALTAVFGADHRDP
jgi:TetR/AcrR family transcriptional repressor of nem operon